MITFGSINSKETEIKQKTLSFKKRKLEKSNGEQSDVHDKVRKLRKLKSLETEEDGVRNFLDRVVVTLQNIYKNYKTRRNLAVRAVVVEELWWKELESAALTGSSESFFNSYEVETAISRWKRAGIWATKVGKGLSKEENALTLDAMHWLEAIDPRHRYGHNLHLYYDVWFARETTQPFFYWLDSGDGKELSLDECPRTNLQHQCIEYLGTKEREAYEVVVENGKLVYKTNRVFVDTPEGSKWIYVVGTSRNFYVGKKKKGLFQHSKFFAGGDTTSSGRLVAHNGTLVAIWPFSGHYRPTEKNFNQFCSFMKDHQVDMTYVKKYPVDDDIPPRVLSKNNDLKLDSLSSDEHMEANIEAKNTTAAALIQEENQKLNNKSKAIIQ